ncbi:hypothetical protein OM280_22995 [Escherichia albertii]|nr:hypothetical protein [Escherichia albertii]
MKRNNFNTEFKHEFAQPVIDLNYTVADIAFFGDKMRDVCKGKILTAFPITLD